MILAGDFGGTKTNLAFYVPGADRPHAQESRRFETKAFDGPGALIEDFLERSGRKATMACLAVAGPVADGRSQLTNLPWTLSEKDLCRRFGWRRCILLNDMTATVQAIPLLEASELAPLQPGTACPRGNLGLLAPGTGLGAALALQRDGDLLPLASEFGHSDFAPIDEEGLSLWRFLAPHHGRVCLEDILSGRGLQRLYRWRRHLGDRHPDPETAEAIATSDDPAACISALALEGADPVCVKALDYFARCLGAAAGNLALTALTRDGLYLAGGIAPKILPKLRDGVFEKAFLAKEPFRHLLEAIPVHVILTEKAPLLGAAKVAMEIS